MDARKMKALRMHVRGGADDLLLEEVDIPEVTDEEVLIRVHSAGITPTEFTWNSTYTTRDGKNRLPVIPAFDVSGVVAAKGSGVGHLEIGGTVYGLLDFWKNGSAAEYVVADGAGIAAMPKSLDFHEAAAVPLSGLTAWQALYDHANLFRGDSVLIHGAGGGVGSIAIQLAHHGGAYVIGTCSKSKADFVRSLGADEVIDYTSVDFQAAVKPVDIVVDTIGGTTLERSWGVLNKGGTLVTIADDIPEGKAESHNVKAVSMLVHPDRSQLEHLAALIDDGKFHPIIQKIFPLEEGKEAYKLGLAGHNAGKIVLKVVG